MKNHLNIFLASGQQILNRFAGINIFVSHYGDLPIFMIKKHKTVNIINICLTKLQKDDMLLLDDTKGFFEYVCRGTS